MRLALPTPTRVHTNGMCSLQPACSSSRRSHFLAAKRWLRRRRASRLGGDSELGTRLGGQSELRAAASTKAAWWDLQACWRTCYKGSWCWEKVLTAFSTMPLSAELIADSLPPFITSTTTWGMSRLWSREEFSKFWKWPEYILNIIDIVSSPPLWLLALHGTGPLCMCVCLYGYNIIVLHTHACICSVYL